MDNYKMLNLPIEIIKYIMSYMSSTASIFKREIKEIKEKFNEADKVGGEFDLSSVKISFAGYYFVTITFLPYGILDNDYEILDNIYRPGYHDQKICGLSPNHTYQIATMLNHIDNDKNIKKPKRYTLKNIYKIWVKL